MTTQKQIDYLIYDNSPFPTFLLNAPMQGVIIRFKNNKIMIDEKEYDLSSGMGLIIEHLEHEHSGDRFTRIILGTLFPEK